MFYNPDTGKYQAKIKSYGISYNLGCFDTAELAHSAYLNAKDRLHTHSPE